MLVQVAVRTSPQVTEAQAAVAHMVDRAVRTVDPETDSPVAGMAAATPAVRMVAVPLILDIDRITIAQ